MEDQWRRMKGDCSKISRVALTPGAITFASESDYAHSAVDEVH